VNHCIGCGSYYISPSPSETQLDEFYSKYDQVHRNKPKISGNQLLKELEKSDPEEDYRFQTIKSLINLKSKKVLDVGFGRGFFLYHFNKLGATVTGLELDPDAIKYAKENLGLTDIHHKKLLDFNPPEKYDLILLMDLIEHVLEPKQYFKKLGQLLMPGGLIVIFTPNADSSLDENEPITFRVDLEHMQYLTAQSCKYISNEFNFEIVKLETIGFPFLQRIVDYNFSELSTKAKVKFVVKKLPGFESVYKFWADHFIKDKSRSGNYHLFCIFKKS
jgi:2-polyprenyl-3-methyl-5-hydroxy-6-metoxy-1,4-benzoquinol methylase